LKLLEERKYPFYVEFSKNIWKSGAKKKLLGSLSFFYEELGLKKSEIESFYGFLYDRINSERNRLMIPVAERRKIIEDRLISSYAEHYSRQIDIMVEEWDASSRLMNYIKEERGYSNYLDNFFRLCGDFVLKFGVKDFASFAEMYPEHALIVFEQGLWRVKDIIKDRDDFVEVLNILMRLAKECPSDLVDQFFREFLGFIAAKDKKELLEGGLNLIKVIRNFDERDFYNMAHNPYLSSNALPIFGKLMSRFGVASFIRIAKACPEDLQHEIFLYGLPACSNLVETEADLNDLTDRLIMIAKTCKKENARSFFRFLMSCKGLMKSVDDFIRITDDILGMFKALDSENFRKLVRILIMERTWILVKDLETLDGLRRIVEKDKGKISIDIMEVVFPLILMHGLGRFGWELEKPWKDIEEFISRLVDFEVNIEGLRFIPEDVFSEIIKNLDADKLSHFLSFIGKDNRYNNCEGLAELGFLSCHVTNAFGGGAALVEGEKRREDAFNNIVNCINNQGENKFQLSFSTLSPKTRSNIAVTSGYGINGSVGVIFDSGFVYESYASDASTVSKKSKSEKSSFRTGSKSRRLETEYAVNFSEGSYNELLARRWTVGGLFYTKGVEAEHINRLKKISNEHSYHLAPNPAYINRRVAFGIPKEIEKVYPVYEIDTETRTWKIVYTPVKKDTVEEFRELIETATADTCRKLSKKDGISKFILEWDRFTSDKTGWQHQFHDFRLDEHTIKLFEFFDSSDEFKNLEDRHQRILKITALLHDITKEGGSVHVRPRPDSDHPERSAEAVMDILPRLKYNTATIKTVYKLIYFHDALGNIAVFGDIGAVPDNPQRFKVKHSLDDLSKVFFKDEIPLLKILTKADIYAIKKNGALLKGDHNFWTVKTGKSVSTELAVDLTVQELFKLMN
jgi:hypothetical protein